MGRDATRGKRLGEEEETWAARVCRLSYQSLGGDAPFFLLNPHTPYRGFSLLRLRVTARVRYRSHRCKGPGMVLTPFLTRGLDTVALPHLPHRLDGSPRSCPVPCPALTRAVSSHAGDSFVYAVLRCAARTAVLPPSSAWSATGSSLLLMPR